MGRLFRKTRPAPVSGHPVPAIDAESGLGNQHELFAQLRREIARSRRHGDRSVLVVFDIRPVRNRSGSGAERLPSPVRHVSRTLLASIRESDLVARLDMTHFAVLLTECDHEGARLFVERVRTRISSTPYVRDEHLGDVYVRAWAGHASWEREINEPEQYVAAAMADLEHSRPKHEVVRPWSQPTAR